MALLPLLSGFERCVPVCDETHNDPRCANAQALQPRARLR
jgi:hypothetical protein